MVNYPRKVILKNNINKYQKQTTIFGNRGMSFEKMINHTNQYYLNSGLAVIHKKPTPVQIVRVDYPKRSRAKIVEAYFRQPSTTDYSGVYQGHYIDFEAKETRQKISMPMKNFHNHQIEHMEAVLKQNGICFVLLYFSTLKDTYLLPATHLINFWKVNKNLKSMPLNYIEDYGFLLASDKIPRVPYLDIVDNKLILGDTK